MEHKKEILFIFHKSMNQQISGTLNDNMIDLIACSFWLFKFSAIISILIHSEFSSNLLWNSIIPFNQSSAYDLISRHAVEVMHSGQVSLKIL